MFFNKKKKEEEQKEFIEYNDEIYGNIIVEHDIKYKEFKIRIKEVNFAGKIVDADFRIDDTINYKLLIENLKKFCNNYELFKEKIYSGLLSYYKKDGIYDEEDNMIEVTETFLKEDFKFYGFWIETENIISLHGGIGDDVNDISIDYNCDDDTFDFYSL